MVVRGHYLDVHASYPQKRLHNTQKVSTLPLLLLQHPPSHHVCPQQPQVFHPFPPFILRTCHLRHEGLKLGLSTTRSPRAKT